MKDSIAVGELKISIFSGNNCTNLEEKKFMCLVLHIIVYILPFDGPFLPDNDLLQSLRHDGMHQIPLISAVFHLLGPDSDFLPLAV
jgi:hypothetical protein